MNLEQAIASSELRRKVGHSTETQQVRQAVDVARRVFEVSAMAQEPYENMKPEDWAHRWLASQTFVLAEIAPHHVAVPNVNRIDSSKVQATLQCSAEEIEPIVVDINKQGIGATHGGYVPKFIVVDGKHRHRAQVLRGKDRILAWVGDLAMAEMKSKNSAKQFVIKAAAKPFPEKGTRFDGLADIYAAVAPPSAAITRQDVGDGGSRPTGGTTVPKMANAGGGGMGGLGSGSGMNPTRKGIFSQNARSSGSLEEPDPSDTKAEPDPSDRNKTFPDPSDRLQWNAKKPQTKAPGADYKPFKWLDQGGASAGSGVGPHLTQKQMRAYGTSEGAEKGWESRGGSNKGAEHLNNSDKAFLDSWLRQHKPSEDEQKSNDALKKMYTWTGGLNAKKKKSKSMEAGPIRVKKIITSPKGQK